MRAQNKVVVITGASMGIGEATARVFLEEGASVVLTSRDFSRAAAAQGRMNSPERTLALACDVCQRKQIDDLVRASLARFGRIDVWINNAGHGLLDSVAEMSPTESRRLFDTNLFAVVDCMQAVIPLMKRQGGGSIINISSVAGHIPVPYMAAYSASKNALIALGKAARLELAARNIRVSTVSPGYIATDFSANAVKGADRQRMNAAKHSVSAERCAHAIFRAYLRNKREVVVPWWYWLLLRLYELCPGIVEFGMRRMLRPADQVITEIQGTQRSSP